MGKRIAAVLCVMTVLSGRHQASAQCEFVATSVSPNILGRHLNPPYVYVDFKGAGVADGDTLIFDATGLFGGPYTYEFDNNSAVAPGSIAVTLTATDNVTASRAIVAAVNGNASSPFSAFPVPVGTDDQYTSFVWKELAGYGAVTQNPVDANNSINVSGNFSYQASGNTYFQVHGANLNPGTPNIGARLRSQVDNTITIAGTVSLRSANMLTVRVSMGLGATPFPAGLYDLELTRNTTPTPCPVFVLPGAVTIVDNLLSDPTFQTNILGNPGSIQWNVGLNTSWLPLVWHTNNITTYPQSGDEWECVKRGDKFHPYQDPPRETRLECPRQGDFPTGALETNGPGDNEWATIRWDPAHGIGQGRHQFWQYINTNLPETSFATLSGVWLGGTTLPSTLTYGIEIRDGDENGTLVAQTPPQQTIDRFDWTPFSCTLTLPGGPHRLAVVIYGDNSADADAGLHIDNLLLRVGARFWPDLNNDGDVDMDDFGEWQRCYTGGGGTVSQDCASLDRDTDGDLDESDFNAWRACGTGSNVPMTATSIPPGCNL